MGQLLQKLCGEQGYLKKEHGLQLLTNNVYIPTLKCTQENDTCDAKLTLHNI